jgi:hypothetical protein
MRGCLNLKRDIGRAALENRPAKSFHLPLRVGFGAGFFVAGFAGGFAFAMCHLLLVRGIAGRAMSSACRFVIMVCSGLGRGKLAVRCVARAGIVSNIAALRDCVWRCQIVVRPRCGAGALRVTPSLQRAVRLLAGRAGRIIDGRRSSGSGANEIWRSVSHVVLPFHFACH